MSGLSQRLVLAIVLAALPARPPPDLNAQTGPWKVDERVLIDDFGVVTALAWSPQGLYVATTGGLLNLDEAFGEWRLPIGVDDGYPVLPVTAMVYDHRDGSLWLSAGGDLLQLDPFGRRFTDLIPVGRRAEALVPAEAAGSDLFLRSGGEWWRFDTFGRDLRRADPAAVRAAIDTRPDLRARRDALADPFFRDGLEQVTRDSRGRSVPVTDVVQARDAYGWWVGTAGEGLFRYDHVARLGERRAYGPVGRGMSSVAVTNGAVWFAPTSALEGRYGIAASGPDLQEWKVWRSDSTYAVPSGVKALLGQADGMWAGGESGLHRLEAEVQRWSEVPGVDAALRPVLTLAPASGADGGGTWVGTARGLLRVVGAAADPDVSLLPAEVVTCVLEAAGAVWIGTPHGLFTSPVDGPSGEVPPAGRTAGPAALRGSVGGIAAVGDTIVVGLDAEVWWLPGAPAEWARVDAVGRQRGPITAVAVHDGTLWVGSRAELTVWDMRGGAVRHLTFGVDIPPDERGATGISAIAPTSRSEAWLATPAGAVRIETGL